MIIARIILISLMSIFILIPQQISAQGLSQASSIVVSDSEATLSANATDSADATMSAQEATRSGIVERIVERRPDITEPEGEVKGRLERYLEEKEIGPLGITNFLQHAIRRAVSQGVPANTIVLMLLFPLLSAIIAAARHLIGLRGFGIFVPAVLSVAFVAMGVISGIVMFIVILLVANLGRRLIQKARLQYLPRMALLLWVVALGVLATLFIAPWFNLGDLANINIFPILILILLSENFIEIQYGKSKREAIELTAETVVLAAICSVILSMDVLQRLALLYPEFIVTSVALFNIFMGRYEGLRITEYIKFRSLA